MCAFLAGCTCTWCIHLLHGQSTFECIAHGRQMRTGRKPKRAVRSLRHHVVLPICTPMLKVNATRPGRELQTKSSMPLAGASRRDVGDRFGTLRVFRLTCLGHATESAASTGRRHRRSLQWQRQWSYVRDRFAADPAADCKHKSPRRLLGVWLVTDFAFKCVNLVLMALCELRSESRWLACLTKGIMP